MCGRFAISNPRFSRIEATLGATLPGGPPPLQHLSLTEHPGHPRVRQRDPPCTIVVGRPNELVAEIHDRMAVILPEEAYATWLNPRTTLDTVRSLMEPYPAARMRAARVSFSGAYVLSDEVESQDVARNRHSRGIEGGAAFADRAAQGEGSTFNQHIGVSVMKRVFLALLLAASAATVLADVWVQPYVRSDGTYVQGHHRSDPNGSRFDNYSSRGNTNPYTGERGYRDPYSAPSYSAPQAGGYRYGRDND